MAYSFTVTITDEEYRAFELRVEDPDAWVDHAVRNKVRKNMEWIAEEAAKDGSFDPEAQAEIEALMIEHGDVRKHPREYSDVVKQKMAEKIKMKTRKQRDIDDVERFLKVGSQPT